MLHAFLASCRKRRVYFEVGINYSSLSYSCVFRGHASKALGPNPTLVSEGNGVEGHSSTV
jgi:hypothetical protein